MQTVTSKDGTRIAYDIEGTGSLLIFITGATCFRKFFPVVVDAKVFATKFRVVNYDRRGRGDSSDILPYSPARELDDIEALIDALGGQAYIYGHSSGAVLALEAALRFPDKIKKLAIYDASYVHSASEKNEYAKLMEEISALIQTGSYAPALRRFLIGIGMPKFFALLLPLFPGWRTMKALAPTLLYDMELTKDLPPVSRLTALRVPLLIMFGAKNPPSIHHVAESLAKGILHAKLERFETLDHMASIKKLLPSIERFFETKD